MHRLVVLLGGDAETASGLAGLGDLNVTCNRGRRRPPPSLTPPPPVPDARWSGSPGRPSRPARQRQPRDRAGRSRPCFPPPKRDAKTARAAGTPSADRCPPPWRSSPVFFFKDPVPPTVSPLAPPPNPPP